MADGHFPTLVSKDREANAQTNTIWVSLSDGTDAALVDGSGNLQVVSAANDGVDIGDVTINNPIFNAEAALTATEGIMLALDDGTNAVFAQANAGGDLKVTLDGEEVEVTLNGEEVEVTLNGEEVEVTLNGELVSVTGADGAALHAAANPLYVQLTDGTSVLASTSQALHTLAQANDGVDIGDVDVTSVIPGVGATNLGKAIGSAAGATDTGVAALAIRDDALSALADAEGDYVGLRVDGEGALWVTGDISVTPESVHVDDAAFTVATDQVTAIAGIATADSVDAGDVGALRMLTNRALVATIEDANGDGIAVDASGNLAIDIAAQTLTAVAVSKDSSANSETNPIFVKTVNTALSASEIHDYDTAAAVAGDATDNHDYSVTGSNFLLKKVLCASSGAAKFEVLVGPVAGLAAKAVAFISKQGGFEEINFELPIEVPVAATGTVRVARTNREGSAQDLYSTIIGNDV